MTPLYTTAAGFDKAAIMRRAAVIRREMAERFGMDSLRPNERREAARALRSEPLTRAWQEAHNIRFDLARAAERAAQDAAIAATIPAPERAARADALRREATCAEMLDRTGRGYTGASRMNREADALAV